MFVVKKLLLRKTGGLITNFRVIRPCSYEPDLTVGLDRKSCLKKSILGASNVQEVHIVFNRDFN